MSVYRWWRAGSCFFLFIYSSCLLLLLHHSVCLFGWLLLAALVLAMRTIQPDRHTHTPWVCRVWNMIFDIIKYHRVHRRRRHTFYLCVYVVNEEIVRIVTKSIFFPLLLTLPLFFSSQCIVASTIVVVFSCQTISFWCIRFSTGTIFHTFSLNVLFFLCVCLFHFSSFVDEIALISRFYYTS